MSNGGPATDAAGNIYFSTGDGTFDPSTGSYGDSLVRINPVGTVLDYFTPFDQAAIDAVDADFGAGGILLLPDQPGAHPHLVITAGKDESMYLLDRDDLGRHTSDDSQVVQVLRDVFPFGTPEPGNYSAPVYFNGVVYISPVAEPVKAFPLSNGLLSTSPASQSATIFPYRGGALAISANGTANGILWAVEHPGPTTPGVLRAYEPSNLAIELYNSDQADTRDTLGVAGKFSAPLIANGKVFVGAASRLVVYGLLP
jgi:outer membrane protein assembly factor BamB